MARRTWFSPSVLLIVIVGGAVGVALRAAVVVPLGGLSHPLVVPAATLAINLVGAFLLGIIVGRLATTPRGCAPFSAPASWAASPPTARSPCSR